MKKQRIRVRAGLSRSSGSGFSALDSDFGSFKSLTDAPISSFLNGRLAALRARSRSQIRNNPLARGYVSLMVDNVIGADGPNLKPRPVDSQGNIDKDAAKVISEAYQAWSKNPNNCDYAGRFTLPRLLRTIYSHRLADGEGFVRFRPGGDFGLRLEIVDPGRIPEWAASTNDSSMGIVLDDDYRPKGYLVTPRRKPNEGSAYFYQHTDANIVDRSKMAHIFDATEADQLRGLPALTPVLVHLSTLTEFIGAAVKNAKAGAAKLGAFQQSGVGGSAFKGELDGDDEDNENELGIIDTEFMSVMELPPGVEFKSFDTRYPTAEFEKFVSTACKWIASGLKVSHHGLTGDLSGVNYSAGRLGDIQQRKTFRTEHELMEYQLYLRMYRMWLSRALLAGMIPGYSASDFNRLAPVDFIPPTYEDSDPVKSAQAISLDLTNGLTSRRRIIDARGEDPDEVFKEIKEEADLLGVVPVITINPDEDSEDEPTKKD